MSTALRTETVNSSVTIRTIYERRSVRRYKDQPVSRKMIKKIIDAGRIAPSAMNKQSWHFYVLTSDSTIRQFSKEIARIGMKEIAKAGPVKMVKTVLGLLHSTYISGILKGKDPVFHGAPVVIFITAPKDNEWAALDIGMCAQNMMLAAKSLGMDSCPVGFGKFVGQTKIYERLNVPVSHQVHLAVVLGYGDENPEVHKRVQNNLFFIDPWDS